jgi:nitroreductase
MNEVLQQALEWRYAVKKFDATKKVTETDWKTLEASLVLSPSSYGLQPWKFIVVQNPQLRQQLRDVSWGQSQVTDCSHYVVLAYKSKMDEAHVQKYIDRMAQVRNIPVASLDGFKNVIIGDVVKGPRAEVIEWWAQRQTYIAMGFLMETAALLKIDSCPMEGLDPKAYDKLLGLEATGWATVAAVALGYRHSEDVLQKAKKVRFETKEILQFL